MKIAGPYFDSVIDTENGFLNTMVIEHARLMYLLMTDLVQQIGGATGKITISEKDKPCPLAKKLEVLDRFIPFDINTKGLLSKLTTYLERNALETEQYEAGMQLLVAIEEYIDSVSLDLPCEIELTKLNLGSLVKAFGIELRNDYHSLAEQVIDYMELVRELENDKLFVLINFRSFVSDNELEVFAQDVLSRHYHVLLIDAVSGVRLDCEKRITIDADWCEI